MKMSGHTESRSRRSRSESRSRRSRSPVVTHDDVLIPVNAEFSQYVKWIDEMAETSASPLQTKINAAEAMLKMVICDKHIQKTEYNRMKDLQCELEHENKLLLKKLTEVEEEISRYKYENYIVSSLSICNQCGIEHYPHCINSNE
ncbi:uncharacterized protein LOC135842878 [Planococcus citri]|uniref:uncharacterized protein LOC135842878 n=1 Tax=Planococcus citri TaxID=170843 RepID=UPI0031FA32BE